ncbi:MULTISPECIES: hypothetical protein [unclassified Bradyrhizobium]|nr:MULTISPECIES: hypothetical protein [unclassified Bradyrhizobium]
MDIDLPPHQWKSDRPKPHEPIFGPGLPNALAYAVGWIATVALLYLLRR